MHHILSETWSRRGGAWGGGVMPGAHGAVALPRFWLRKPGDGPVPVPAHVMILDGPLPFMRHSGPGFTVSECHWPGGGGQRLSECAGRYFWVIGAGAHSASQRWAGRKGLEALKRERKVTSGPKYTQMYDHHSNLSRRQSPVALRTIPPQHLWGCSKNAASWQQLWLMV